MEIELHMPLAHFLSQIPWAGGRWTKPDIQGTVESGAVGWVALWKQHKIIVASSVTKSSGQ